jgi:hypothetical protein
MEDKFRNLLATKSPELSKPRKTQSRFALWVPRQDENDQGRRLFPTGFREGKGFPGYLKEPGPTRYNIDRDDNQGPPGMAFVTREMVITPPLPEYGRSKTSKAIYCATLAPFKLSPQILEHWQRHARRILSIPISLLGSSTEADIVLCIDCADPLEDFDDNGLREIVDKLDTEHGSHLAVLWLLKMNL